MIFPRTIRNRLIWLQLLPMVVVVILAAVLLQSVRDYRRQADLTTQESQRAEPLKSLERSVGKLRQTQSEIHFSVARPTIKTFFTHERQVKASEFERELTSFRRQCVDYARAFGSPDALTARDDPQMQIFQAMQAPLMRIVEAIRAETWCDEAATLDSIGQELEQLRDETERLTQLLFSQLQRSAVEAQLRYRRFLWWIPVLVIGAGVMMGCVMMLFSRWMTRPLREIIGGARRVAAGELSHRIALASRDEMAEIAEAINTMTSRFQEIRDDLDRQVRERTAEALQNERLASVGFLAAGVAHEINNPLAAIAICAESLQKRLATNVPNTSEETTSTSGTVQHSDTIQNYCRVIEQEAFRCQGITERLLGLARAPSSGSERETVTLAPLVNDMITVLQAQGKYRDKRIHRDLDTNATARINSQEIKQVILNLFTNACEATAPDGAITVTLRNNTNNNTTADNTAVLTITDDGHGMTGEVLKHAFEPFFTRRTSGKGTGLGLSISHRIIADHGGRLTAESPGEDCGATFTMILPTRENL